ncbi:MAG: patatin-like phospholipase family protein [Spirochaetaceae bacterium]|nr:patatin-like phospholipase family protein [Spirochaetaceae bacterium]
MKLPAVLKKNKSLGLALGGGAVLGFAHVGVFKALAEAGISPAAVAGTSAGSLFGALYCAGLSWQDILAASGKISWLDLVTPTVPLMGLLKAEGLEKVAGRLTEGKNIEELAIPFRAVTTDLATGKQVVISSGPAARAVRASCSIPGIFTPLEDEGRLLADGGLVNNIPADVVRAMGADYVIAVDVVSAADGRKPSNIGEVIFRSMTILIAGTNSLGIRQADLFVRPDLAGIYPHDMAKKQQIIAAGEEAMKKLLPRIPRAYRKS